MLLTLDMWFGCAELSGKQRSEENLLQLEIDVPKGMLPHGEQAIYFETSQCKALENFTREKFGRKWCNLQEISDGRQQKTT